MRITEESLKEKALPGTTPEASAVGKKVTEREKLKAMSKQDRRWYIWNYYKFHMLVAVAAIGILWIIGTSLYQQTFKTALYCMYLNTYTETELNTAPLEQGFAEYMELGKKQPIITESAQISYGENATELSYVSMTKVTALVAAKELDIIIGDEENMAHYTTMDGMADLEAELPEDTLNLVRDRLIYSTGTDGAQHAYGLSLEGTWFAEESGLSQDPPILGMVSNSTRKDNVTSLLHYIFAQ